MRAPGPAQASIRPAFIPELDLVRALTCAAVVGVHALGMVGGLAAPASPAGLAVGALTTLLHYSREAFMIVMGLVLAHAHRQHFDGRHFYRHRLTGRILPYALWTGAYLLLLPGPHPGAHLWWSGFWRHLALGSASYQLYYMVVAVQFYAVAPVLLALLRHRPRCHVPLLMGALAWQVAWYALFVPWASHHVLGPYSLGFLQVRSLLAYPFFFVLGALGGWHLPSVRAALRRHRPTVVGLALTSVAALLLRYILVAGPLGYGVGIASSVFEPAMIPYAALATASLWVIGGALAEASSVLAGAVRRVVRFVSGASFGIYLVHVLVLRWIHAALAPIGGGPFGAWLVLFPVTFVLSLAATRALSGLPWLEKLFGLSESAPLTTASRPPAA